MSDIKNEIIINPMIPLMPLKNIAANADKVAPTAAIPSKTPGFAYFINAVKINREAEKSRMEVR